MADQTVEKIAISEAKAAALYEQGTVSCDTTAFHPQTCSGNRNAPDHSDIQMIGGMSVQDFPVYGRTA